MQLLSDAQEMHDATLDMRVKAALLSNRLARLDSILVAEKFAGLLQRADELLAMEPPPMEPVPPMSDEEAAYLSDEDY